MMGDSSSHGKSGKQEYANIFTGNLVLLGTFPRPKTKGKESEPDRIEDDLPPLREDLPKRVVRDLPKGTSQRVVWKRGRWT